MVVFIINFLFRASLYLGFTGVHCNSEHISSELSKLYGDNIKLYAYSEHMVVSFVERSAGSSLLHQYGLCTKLFGLVC